MNWLEALANNERNFLVVDDGPIVQAIVPTLLDNIVLGEGVLGLQLVGLDVDNASFQTISGTEGDTIVVDGISGIIDDLETDGFDVTNDESEFRTINLDDGESQDVGTGLTVDGDNFAGLLAEVIAGDRPFVELTGIDTDNATFVIDTPNGAKDTLIVDGAEQQIADVAQDFLRVNNDESELTIFREGDVRVFVGNTSAVSDEFAELAGADGPLGFLNKRFINESEVFDIVEELILGDGIDGVSLLNVDNDTATITAENNGHTDIIVFDGFDFEGALSNHSDTEMM